MKCRISFSKLKFSCEPAKVNSMLLMNENVYAVHEFAKDKIIIYSNNSDLLLVAHEWIVIHEISDSEIRNSLKHWLRPLPGFNADTFPLMLCSGNESYSLINVKTGKR